MPAPCGSPASLSPVLDALTELGLGVHSDQSLRVLSMAAFINPSPSPSPSLPRSERCGLCQERYPRGDCAQGASLRQGDGGAPHDQAADGKGFLPLPVSN